MATDTAPTGDYTLDPAHSTIGFVARHTMVTKVRGTFTDVSGTGHFDADDPTRSTFSLTAQVASVDTNNAQRDEHLRTNDFFDAPNHPEITFHSTAVKTVDDAHYEVEGELSVRGVTKSISFPSS